MLRHEILADTAGAGYNRGGAGVVRDSLWLEPAHHYSCRCAYKRPDRLRRQRREGRQQRRDLDLGALVPGRRRPVQPTDDAYGDAIPVAGYLDPVTNAPSRDGEFVCFLRVPLVANARRSRCSATSTNGGGGYGDPLDREPERVGADVRDGYVTIEGAARDYGVVVSGDPDEDPEGLVVDLEATEQLRRVQA